MSKKFTGTINLDIRNSVEDWDAFTQPSPPIGSLQARMLGAQLT